jgi:hypothetical protein
MQNGNNEMLNKLKITAMADGIIMPCHNLLKLY